MTLLEKIKANLILEHSVDVRCEMYITAAVSYAKAISTSRRAGMQNTRCRPPPNRPL